MHTTVYAAGAHCFIILLALSGVCGRLEPDTVPLIAGAHAAPRGRYPYAVSLRSPFRNEHFCGGVLVHPRWVLTSGTCGLEFRDSGIIHIGGYELNDPLAEVRKPDGPPVFPGGFNPNKPLDGNDLALIRLNAGSTKQQIQLPQAGSDQGNSFTALGWGRHSPSSGFSEYLSHLESMVRSSDNRCQKVSNSLNLDKMLCAGTHDNLCPGDEGGPLVKNGGSSLGDILVGISTSQGPFRSNCGLGENPTVFTAVSSSMKWISKTIQSN